MLKTTAISQIDNQHSMTTYMDHLDSLKVQVDAIHTITCISRKHPLLIWIPESLMVAIGLVTTHTHIIVEIEETSHTHMDVKHSVTSEI